jgi:hypothetical protein
VQHLRYVMIEYQAHHSMAWPQQVRQGIGRDDGVGEIALKALRDQDRGHLRGIRQRPRGGAIWPVARIGRIISARSIAGFGGE